MKTGFTGAEGPPHNQLALGNLAPHAESDWLLSLSTRGGPLVAAARGFMRDHFASCGGAFPGSVSLVRELARAMQRWLTIDEVDADAERAFVEGAGATLGIILIVHVGDASHAARGNVHRVRLRKHGFFDPFAAVDRALDAPDVRAALAREVACAEAEAQGHGPTARVVLALSRALAERHPTLRICDQFEGLVTLESEDGKDRIELDLQRAIDTTRDQHPAAAEQVAQRYLSMLPGAAQGDETFESLRARLLPRIVRSDVLSDLSASGRAALFSIPLIAELSVSVVVQEQGRARYLRRSEVDSFSIPSTEIIRIANENLQACSTQMRLLPLKEQPSIYLARTGDGRDSARVLLPTLHAALRAKFQAELCIGLPHRDTFMVCAANDDHAVRALARKVAEDAARAPHKLSCDLFMLSEHGLRPYAPR